MFATCSTTLDLVFDGFGDGVYDGTARTLSHERDSCLALPAGEIVAAIKLKQEANCTLGNYTHDLMLLYFIAGVYMTFLTDYSCDNRGGRGRRDCSPRKWRRVLLRHRPSSLVPDGRTGFASLHG